MPQRDAAAGLYRTGGQNRFAAPLLEKCEKPEMAWYFQSALSAPYGRESGSPNWMKIL